MPWPFMYAPLYLNFVFFLAFTPFLLPPCLFDSAVHASWCLSFVVWRMCGLLGLYPLPFTPSWTERCLGKSPHLPAKPMFSFSMSMGFLVIDPVISLCRACYSFTFPFIACYSVGLRTNAPVVLAYFFINLLLRTPKAHFSHLFLFWALLASIPVVLAHYFIPQAFLTRLLPFYLFYSYELFARIFGLPRPNYHIFTSYYLFGLIGL